MSMILWQLVVAYSFAAADGNLPDVEVRTLDGEAVVGRLSRLTPREMLLAVGDEERRIPQRELLDAVLRSTEETKPVPAPIVVRLTDGSVVPAGELSVAGKTARMGTPFGRLRFPTSRVSSVRYVTEDIENAAALAAAWRELEQRKLKDDMLVIRKGDVLDHLGGVLGDIDAEQVKFLLDGEQVTVARQKVYGVIYRREAERKAANCRVEMFGGRQLLARDVTLQSDHLRVRMLAGPTADVPLAAVRRLDFSATKVAFLSDLDPSGVDFTPYFDNVEGLYEIQRDRSRDYRDIRLGGQVFQRGLWIHSRTQVRYRLRGEYRRLRAIMGIEDRVRPNGDVEVVIRGDGNVLFKSRVRGRDKPQTIDLDIAGVRDLELLVDFGDDLDIADHLVLAEAKVVK